MLDRAKALFVLWIDSVIFKPTILQPFCQSRRKITQGQVQLTTAAILRRQVLMRAWGQPSKPVARGLEGHHLQAVASIDGRRHRHVGQRHHWRRHLRQWKIISDFFFVEAWIKGLVYLTRCYQDVSSPGCLHQAWCCSEQLCSQGYHDGDICQLPDNHVSSLRG